MATKQKTHRNAGKKAPRTSTRIARPKAKAIPTLGEIGLEQFAPYLINRIAARWNADLQPTLREKNLTTVHMRVLAVLSVCDGRTINELSALTVTEQSTLSRALDVVEGLGLIERRAVESDARFVEVYITDKGRRRFNEFWPSMYEQFSRMFDGIEEDEVDQFMTTMKKVLTNIKRRPY